MATRVCDRWLSARSRCIHSYSEWDGVSVAYVGHLHINHANILIDRHTEFSSVSKYASRDWFIIFFLSNWNSQLPFNQQLCSNRKLISIIKPILIMRQSSSTIHKIGVSVMNIRSSTSEHVSSQIIRSECLSSVMSINLNEWLWEPLIVTLLRSRDLWSTHRNVGDAPDYHTNKHCRENIYTPNWMTTNHHQYNRPCRHRHSDAANKCAAK